MSDRWFEVVELQEDKLGAVLHLFISERGAAFHSDFQVYALSDGCRSKLRLNCTPYEEGLLKMHFGEKAKWSRCTGALPPPLTDGEPWIRFFP